MNDYVELEEVLNLVDDNISETEVEIKQMHRLKVPGGWIVLTTTYLFLIKDHPDAQSKITSNMMFLADSQHEWVNPKLCT